MKLTEQQFERLKKVELNLLKVFIDVCNKLKLRYYVIDGTLLGTVRHGGFIPWDDDIDVAMPREDYDVLVEKGNELIPDYLFFQSSHSDSKLPMNFCKLRDSRTTFVEESIKHFDVNHGVYIDIFPLDYYPEKKYQQLIFKYTNTVLNEVINKEFDLPPNKSIKSRIAIALGSLLASDYKKAISKREKLFKSVKPSRYLAHYCGAWGDREIVPIEWYGEGVVLKFEDIEVVAPICYKKWLERVYGDYMTPPPPEKRVAHHYVGAFDLDNSYVDAWTNNKNK